MPHDNTTDVMPMHSRKLHEQEEHFRIRSHIDGLHMFLRRLQPGPHSTATAGVVLYVHGGTFPSALSIAHPFDGRSWRDELCAAGFDVWAVDFLGFGESDRYPEMDEPAERHPPLGLAEIASRQLEQVVHWICNHLGTQAISIIAHSWGTIVAGRFAGEHPELVKRLVFFGPVTSRSGADEPQRYPAWRLVSLEDQWTRFTADVPAGEPAVLAGRHFDEWGPSYLDTDPESRTRTPASVKIPSGPWQDIANAWAGQLAYDPAKIHAPVAIIRGEWDSVITDEDARWLFDALSASPVRRDIKIGRATHLMHLEETRHALYRETEAFLKGGDLDQCREDLQHD